jgi:hypothetical protein
MLLASIRLGILLTALVVSLHVAAAPRFWTLTGVEFNDASHATGYFSYDDATKTVSSWNVRVEYFPYVFVPPFTYVPGNSVMSVSQPSGAAAPTLGFSAAIDAPDAGGWPGFGVRQLQITPLTALDGSNATVSLDTSLTKEAIPSLGPTRVRSLRTGSLTLTLVPTPIVVARVDEFYNPTLRHYFITADDAEKQALDTEVHPGWQRTGESFKAYAKNSSTGVSINPVCRYYSPASIETEQGSLAGFDSHFFTADAGECVNVFRRYANWVWVLEDDNAFQIALPDKTSGACPVGTIPVYRLWNQRVDSNHRYTTSAAIKAQMLAAGYLAEGYGPGAIAMCAPQ